jgi:hypothetical protein
MGANVTVTHPFKQNIKTNPIPEKKKEKTRGQEKIN